MAVFDVKNLSTAFGNLSLSSMRFYTGLNVKIIIDILNFYFYFVTKDSSYQNQVWLQRLPLNFSKFLTSI